MNNEVIVNDVKYKKVFDDKSKPLCSKCCFGVYIPSEKEWGCIGPREIVWSGNYKCADDKFYWEEVK